MKLKICGAARDVTGSAHLLTLDDGFQILFDCGMYQGKNDMLDDFNERWKFDASKIDCLILSHAHIDHAGRIPKLVKDGFRGEIYCTKATKSLASIMLKDSAKIQERDADYHNKHSSDKVEALYNEEDVERAMRFFVGLSYNRWHYLTEGAEMYFTDAGHILGSASITLRIRQGEKTTLFGFSGDIGRPNRPILKDPVPMPTVDYLICESTYGDKVHTEPPAEMARLLQIIHETCIKRRGKLMIPSFSIGRTQEIVYMLDQLSTYKELPKIPVYVDSPLAVDATDIFGMHPECFDEEMNNYLKIDSDPFGFHSLRYLRSVSDSKRLNRSKDPCIIISSSGMANAGRIKHHIFNNIEDERNAVLIVGYCAPYTPGGQLRNGAKSLWLFNETKQVNAHVYVMDSFSAHADKFEILNFLSHQDDRLKNIFLVHGRYDVQLRLKRLLELKGFEGVEIPSLGQTFDLD